MTTFSDGVIAVIITVTVLDLKVQTRDRGLKLSLLFGERNDRALGGRTIVI